MCSCCNLCAPADHGSFFCLASFRQVYLIFGRTGWIGGLVGQYLKDQGAKFEYANCRLEDRAAVISEIERVSVQPVLSQLLVPGHHHGRQGGLLTPCPLSHAGQAHPCAERSWPHRQAKRGLV